MNNELAEFEKYVSQELEQQKKLAIEKTEEVLKEKVQKNLYEAYTPKAYTRTNNLKDSISKDDNRVYFDEKKLNHTSKVSGQPVKLVPQYTNFGHKDDSGIDNMYHDYPNRHFIEDTIKEMQGNEELNMFDYEMVNN
jgi:hypothetical protein